jgi:hypothetical protein
MGKARIFSEAMPFIRAYRDRIVVIKYGGSAMVDETLRSTFADDVAMLHYVGIKPVIVHGGGPQISRAMGQRGIEPQWIDGLRITDADTIRVVQSTLAGEINPDIVRLVNTHGSLAAGVSGLDANLFEATPRDRWRGSTRGSSTACRSRGTCRWWRHSLAARTATPTTSTPTPPPAPWLRRWVPPNWYT